MSKRTTMFVAGAALLLAALVAAPLVRHGERVQYLTSKVERGEIKDAVDATGVVNAVVNVQVGSQVSGTIAKLNADFNSHVLKVDEIAEIDLRLFESAVQHATADVENAKSNVIAANANLAKTRAALVETKAEYDRAQNMMRTNIGTQQALDVAKANYDSARAAVEGAQASVVQANAQVSQKQAALSVAQTTRAFTVIRSPIDGTVVARNVDVGQTVAASLQAPTIFTIAQDLVKMYLYAKVDESDVGRIRAGQPVTFKVDAFPKEIFHGNVAQIRMNPTTVQNVVTYDAVIEFENRDLKLFPGMTAYVTIPVATVENVEKLPNAALRFKPPMTPEEVRARYALAGIARDDAPVVWKLRGDAIEPVEVALGITDHSYTEVRRVMAGALKPGDDVVTSAIGGPKPAAPGAEGVWGIARRG